MCDNKKIVTYEAFGAKGDGVTDDFEAIYRAHEYANENGLPIVASDSANYYLHDPRVDGEVKEILIKTDCSWGEAKFTIDDRDISTMRGADTYEWHTKAIFKVVSDYSVYRIDDEKLLSDVVAAGLNRSSECVALKFDYPVMIIPYNDSHKVYRRRGYSGWRGSPMHEIIVLDKDGNIDSETPVMFNYNHIDYIDVYRLDIKPITLSGGVFTTRASRINTLIKCEDGTYKNYGGYLHRGINIQRSFTTLKNVKHYITDEVSMREQVDENGEVVHISACYQGFYLASYSNHVFFEDCVISGRRCYNYRTGGAGGTYGLSGNAVNKIVFKNCVQSNFWVTVDENYDIHPAKENDEGAMTSMSSYVVKGRSLMMHWGIGGTNFCKNMEYIDCLLSRYDAHSGLYHGKIVNSTINGMEVVGVGNLILENSRWFAAASNIRAGAGNSLVYLRNDYASTWEGEITIKNFTAYVHSKTSNTYLLSHSYNNWYYGYRAYFPNVSVENFLVYDFDTREPVSSDYELRLTGISLLAEPKLHLPVTRNTPRLFPDVDEDGDGFVDGTKIPYDNEENRHGVPDPENFENVNPIVPPKYIKVINGARAGSCNVLIADTSVFEGGGFWKDTEFVTKDATYIGTSGHGETSTFKFVPYETLMY